MSPNQLEKDSDEETKTSIASKLKCAIIMSLGRPQ